MKISKESFPILIIIEQFFEFLQVPQLSNNFSGMHLKCCKKTDCNWKDIYCCHHLSNLKYPWLDKWDSDDLFRLLKLETNGAEFVLARLGDLHGNFFILLGKWHPYWWPSFKCWATGCLSYCQWFIKMGKTEVEFVSYPFTPWKSFLFASVPPSQLCILCKVIGQKENWNVYLKLCN